MVFICGFRKGDITKCIPIFIVGAVLLVAGIPLMIIGIVADFPSSDFVGYVGGVCIFFGIVFLFIWYMMTIPNLEKIKSAFDEKECKEATTDTMAASTSGSRTGYANPAFMRETSRSCKTDTEPLNVTKSMTSLDSDDIPRYDLTEAKNSEQRQLNNSNNMEMWQRELVYWNAEKNALTRDTSSSSWNNPQISSISGNMPFNGNYVT